MSLLVTVLLGAMAWCANAFAQAPDASIPPATPPGITLQPLRHGQGAGLEGRGQGGAIPRFDVAYADANGLTLYTYDADTVGKSACSGECAKVWLPALAGENAKPFGSWSIVVRDDGGRQWAYRDRLLYRFSRDQEPGAVGGEPLGAAREDGSAASSSTLPKGWRVALFDLAAEISLPIGISIRHVADANGMALVDASGHTLYTFTGTATEDGTSCAPGQHCSDAWIPLIAPQLARSSVGEFTVIPRTDGQRQWAYKGRGLYKFSDDLAAGYANGDGVDPRWQVAVVRRYFLPDEVRILPVFGRGKLLATQSASVLYRREAGAVATGGGHSLRRGVLLRPAVGREIGIGGCDADCLKQWRPLIAPQGAEPSSYWNLVRRPDGSMQWSYWSFPLYTFVGDKQPGDISGNDIYEIVLSDEPTKVNDIGTAQAGAPAFYWLVSEP